MKLFAALALVIAGVSAQRDSRRHNTHLWMFGEEGVQIFTPDGSTKVKHLPPEKVCKETTNSDGSIRVRCDFMDVVTDGRKYVWSSVARGVPMIDVFRIDTGDLVGSFATCGSPYKMDYHPLREEVWVHCSAFSDTSESHLDVFSAVSPSASIPATIALHDNTALRSFGRLVVDSELGDHAYSTIYGKPYLYKINMAERKVTEQYDMAGDNPKFYGLYDMVFSPQNGHFFIRAEVCCTCGFEGADSLECGRYGAGNITLVGDDGKQYEVEGQCGRHCRGGPTDTIGVLEFDAASEKVVGTHTFVGSAPVYQPFVSPDGKHVVMFGMNGGKTVEILKAGSPGFKSNVDAVLTLDFNTTNVGDYNVFDDFAYIKKDDMELFVVSSSSDYKVAIVDMASPNKDVSYVMLKDTPYVDRARGRQIEWAEGTNYVWIGGRQQNEAYVVDVKEKKLVQTFSEVDARKLVSVRNHAFFNQAQDFGTFLGQSDPASKGGRDATAVASANVSSKADGDGDGGNSTLAIAALVISCIAIVAVFALFSSNNSKAAATAETRPLAGAKNTDEPSVSVPPSVN